MSDRAPETYLPLRPAVLLILHVLLDGERHGYAIVQAVDERSEGTVRLHPGALYRVLHGLLEDGLLAEAAAPAGGEPADPRRVYYRITALGRRVLTAELSRLDRLLAAGRAR
ncbi:MAG: PadR family transcriptional regulator [Gemmatimonadales bacterium]|nr:PadR family transcriptional regulator [Gemmatimonadales bacterium]